MARSLLRTIEPRRRQSLARPSEGGGPAAPPGGSCEMREEPRAVALTRRLRACSSQTPRHVHAPESERTTTSENTGDSAGSLVMGAPSPSSAWPPQPFTPLPPVLASLSLILPLLRRRRLRFPRPSLSPSTRAARVRLRRHDNGPGRADLGRESVKERSVNASYHRT